jgi:hypothetical protein
VPRFSPGMVLQISLGRYLEIGLHLRAYRRGNVEFGLFLTNTISNRNI